MTRDIKLALAKGKTAGATKLLQEYYLAQDKAQYFAGLQAEYDAMYPTYRDMTVEEQLAYDEANFNEENPKPEEFVYPQVEIQYITADEDGNEVRTPAEYVTYNEYINETRVVTEAIEATYDEDGMELTPAVPEVTEMVRPYVASDVTELVDSYLINSNEYKSYLKAKKQEQLDLITVTTSYGNTFDGNETARNNMISTILSSSVVGITSTNWKLADNTVKEVTLEDLKEALALAIQKVGAIVI